MAGHSSIGRCPINLERPGEENEVYRYRIDPPRDFVKYPRLRRPAKPEATAITDAY
jgi:hypothetical protein